MFQQIAFVALETQTDFAANRLLIERTFDQLERHRTGISKHRFVHSYALTRCVYFFYLFRLFVMSPQVISMCLSKYTLFQFVVRSYILWEFINSPTPATPIRRVPIFGPIYWFFKLQITACLCFRTSAASCGPFSDQVNVRGTFRLLHYYI